MTDHARRICDELKVCREEAILYLEGFDWDLDAAMEACRSKNLNFPSLAVESPPEKEESSPYSQSRDELIAQFVSFAVGSDTQDATSYLERSDWDLQRAVSRFRDERRRPTASQRKVNRKLGRLNMQRYLQDETSVAVGTLKELMRGEKVPKAIPPLVSSSHLKVQESTSLVQDGEEKLSPVKESASAEALPSSMMSSSQPEEKLSQWEEEGIKSFFKVAIGASREAAIACLSHSKWNQDDAISYFFGDHAETSQESTSPVKESAEALLSSSMSSIQLTNSPDEEQLLKEEIVKSFRDVVIVASRKAAEACLSHCNWNQEDAVSYFFADYTAANPEIAWSQADIQESSRPIQFREAPRTSSNQLQSSREPLSQSNDELIDIFVQAAGGVVTRDVATSYLTLNNWNVEKAFSCLLEEDGTGSSSSSSNADSTETGNATIASSQADENVKDRDVEGDLGTGLSPVPVTTTLVELEIILDDGGSGSEVWILVRSDQTVRDVRNKIGVFRPEDERDYYLKSNTGVEYRDLDTTVHSITSGSCGSTTLHQMYSS
ncbi:ubiquitin-associated (UBA)/TS-N domain-containing protein-related [Raphanus sativus]|nr:ubiquitin-associated (UBA)/TS-N domain-containing protein-related [Raphanus sativus]